MSPLSSVARQWQRSSAIQVQQVLISLDPSNQRLSVSAELELRQRRPIELAWVLRLDAGGDAGHQQWQGQGSCMGALEIAVDLQDCARLPASARLRLWVRDAHSNEDWLLAEDTALPG
ncbi:MAG: hypothetical protein U1F26_06100 [Lysobacterales bacterium]